MIEESLQLAQAGGKTDFEYVSPTSVLEWVKRPIQFFESICGQLHFNLNLYDVSTSLFFPTDPEIAVKIAANVAAIQSYEDTYTAQAEKEKTEHLEYMRRYVYDYSAIPGTGETSRVHKRTISSYHKDRCAIYFREIIEHEDPAGKVIYWERLVQPAADTSEDSIGYPSSEDCADFDYDCEEYYDSDVGSIKVDCDEYGCRIQANFEEEEEVEKSENEEGLEEEEGAVEMSEIEEGRESEANK